MRGNITSLLSVEARTGDMVHDADWWDACSLVFVQIKMRVGGAGRSNCRAMLLARPLGPGERRACNTATSSFGLPSPRDVGHGSRFHTMARTTQSVSIIFCLMTFQNHLMHALSLIVTQHGPRDGDIAIVSVYNFVLCTKDIEWMHNSERCWSAIHFQSMNWVWWITLNVDNFSLVLLHTGVLLYVNIRWKLCRTSIKAHCTRIRF